MRRHRTYTHVDPDHPPHTVGTVLRWSILDRLLGRRSIAPPGPGAPWVEPDLARLGRQDDPGPHLTWIGHASFLLRLAGRNVLIDPVFARRFGLAYPRHVDPGLTPEQLPPIDLVLVSHAHYDHLDKAAIRALPRDTPAIVPHGVGTWLRRWGMTKVTEGGWWDAVDADPLRVTLTPARHWSRRGFFDLNRSLWCGFVVEDGRHGIYHAGDSAWFERFTDISERFPTLDAAMVPIGAYAPAWFMEHGHMNPEQAGRAFLATGARRLVPMHWGTYQLTDEPLAEPLERLRGWWAEHGPRDDRSLVAMAVGETVSID